MKQTVEFLEMGQGFLTFSSLQNLKNALKAEVYFAHVFFAKEADPVLMKTFFHFLGIWHLFFKKFFTLEGMLWLPYFFLDMRIFFELPFLAVSGVCDFFSPAEEDWGSWKVCPKG